ncbi:MAG: 1-acyl-sn-glycerol-3-phosphate acyltransferase [Actinomycetota bacterium]|nr:1-acyl-sn-glycerol-3-phosphate acyltransferase [Actinomycetota bacterium]
MLRSWYRLTVLGVDNVPARGPVILAANHVGFLDVPVLAAAAPRPVRTLAPDELFVPPLDRMSAAAGQISMAHDGPQVAALRMAREVLEAGESVAIFPEAQRGDGRVARIRHEAAYLALRTGAPVVPVALLGTRRTGMAADALPKRNSRIAVVFGAPFALQTGDDVFRRCVIASAGESLRQHLADMADEAQELTGIRLPDDHPTLDPQPSRST